MVRQLTIPPETAGDDDATEMIRIWLAHNELHVSLLLGMWADAEEAEVDERDAWGELLSDVIRHIANGLEQSHGWDRASTIARIRDELNSCLEGVASDVSGGYSGPLN